VIQELAAEPENFVNAIEAVIEARRPNLDPVKKKEAARQIGFRILGIISTGAVVHAARFVGTEKLKDDIADVVQKNPTSAFRSISAAAQLMRPGEIPIDDIRRLAEDLKKNTFAFTILQSLAGLHLHLFHTKDDAKQKLCEHLNIAMKKSRAIELNTKRTKLLPH